MKTWPLFVCVECVMQPMATYLISVSSCVKLYIHFEVYVLATAHYRLLRDSQVLRLALAIVLSACNLLLYTCVFG